MSHTVLVTGATGYIAKWICAELLRRGHRVVGSARSADRDAEIRAALRTTLDGTDWEARYRTIALDLSSDSGWSAAMEGVDAAMLVASPFPLVQPRDDREIVETAVGGVRRALAAARAAGVGRVILTSSSGAISAREKPGNGTAFTEDDWTDLDHPTATPYFRSKTLAERAAWDDVAEHGGIALTALNPTLVVGPPLDADFGTSIQVLERLHRAKDPMLPRAGFSTVDVRDVAEAHIRALERPETAGKGYLLSERFLWFKDIAAAMKTAVPNRRYPAREAPNALLRVLGLFDPSVRTILPSLGRREEVSAARAEAELGLAFRDTRRGIGEAAIWLDRNMP